MKGFRVAVFALLAAICPSLHAQEAKWFQGSSEHFLLYTDTSEVKAQRLLTDLESRVAGFAAAVGTMRPRQLPIEVFLYKNREDFLAVIPKLAPINGYTPAENDAYLLSGPDRLFLVAKDVSPESIANDAGHALGHALLNHEVIWRPFWLSEAVGEYVRKLGRGADTKAVAAKDGYPVEDLLTIVPSADYKDSDSGGAFRIQSYRLFRLLLDQKPQALREFIRAQDTEEGDLAKLNVDMDDLATKFAAYQETALKMPATGGASIKTSPADLASLSIHRGDLLLAVNQTNEAGRFYNGDSKEARSARAILTRYSRSPAEALLQLERAAQDLPDSGMVQYHFGALETQNKKDLDAQATALERAVKLLPFLGRADAELARVYARIGRAQQSLPLLVRALDLEPEYADQFLAIRAEVLVALNRYSDAMTAMKLAVDLPHGDRKTTDAYLAKATALTRTIENARREVEGKQVDQIRQGLEAKVSVFEPPPLPKPEVLIRSGQINYQIAASSTINVIETVYPEYPEALRAAGKTGRINLRVDIASDGKVKNAVVTTSQLTELNAATVDAVKKWAFKIPPRNGGTPAPMSITLTLTFALQ